MERSRGQSPKSEGRELSEGETLKTNYGYAIGDPRVSVANRIDNEFAYVPRVSRMGAITEEEREQVLTWLFTEELDGELLSSMAGDINLMPVCRSLPYRPRPPSRC